MTIEIIARDQKLFQWLRYLPTDELFAYLLVKNSTVEVVHSLLDQVVIVTGRGNGEGGLVDGNELKPGEHIMKAGMLFTAK